MAVNQTDDRVGWYLNHPSSIVAHQRLDVLTFCHRLLRGAPVSATELCDEERIYAERVCVMEKETSTKRGRRRLDGVRRGRRRLSVCPSSSPLLCFFSIDSRWVFKGAKGSKRASGGPLRAASSAKKQWASGSPDPALLRRGSSISNGMIGLVRQEEEPDPLNSIHHVMQIPS